ncbi:MAG: response regulator transcription factor [Proteobacteria bacterium]|nr:response regulator transcription factor [Pseudomonadota bacterium]
MNLILCCGNITLRERWAAALRPIFTIYQTSTLQELRILVGQRVAFDLLFVHRVLVDREIVMYIRQRQPACKLFILSDRPDDTEGLDFLRLGVVGYANSYINPERLMEAARAVASGSVWVNQQLMQRLIAESAPAAVPEGGQAGGDSQKQQFTNLSNREYQIASLVAEGLSNLEIAEQVGITERTVKAHLGAVYTKTSTRSRLGLALLLNKRKPA